ncbi:MAG: lipopolysaccharide biosynthesis protein [Mobilitalea sp.]
MRLKAITKNVAAMLFKNNINALFSFICRTIFIKTLGETYLGVNGLFTNIFSLLSLMELGVGTSIIYFLYKPLAENNEDEIRGMLGLYRKLYNGIGITIAIIGVSLMPWLPNIVNNSNKIDNLQLIYLLLLLDVVISYLFSYKRSILEADQKSFYIALIDAGFATLMSIIQIVILLMFRNYLLYLTISIFRTFLSNVVIQRVVNKAYPYLRIKKDYKISKDQKKVILSRTMAAFSHKLGGIIVYSTDNILINFMFHLELVGLYSNYVVIINMIYNPLSQIFNSMTASIGNLNAVEKDTEKAYINFNRVTFLNCWVYGFAAICLFNLLNPFITIWIGHKYLLDQFVVLVLVINFLFTGTRMVPNLFNASSGLFYNTRWKPVFESIINLVMSVYLGHKLGLVGIFLGTTCSILVSVIVDPYVLFKKWFQRPLIDYFKLYTKWMSLIAVTGVVINYLGSIILKENIASFIAMLAVNVIGINLFFLVFTFKTDGFAYCKNIAMDIINRKNQADKN